MSNSAVKLAEVLVGLGHRISEGTALRLSKDIGYAMQGNKKSGEGAQHPDRDAQFAYINGAVEAAIAAGQPVMRVDTKKRKLVGDVKAPWARVRAERQAGLGQRP
jgi:hypothetical protein